MTVHSMIAGPMRCGIPTALGMQGTTSDGDEVFALGFEWPAEYASLIGSHEEQKRANEQRQIERVRADFRAGGKDDPFSSVTPGVPDPPDFLCRDAADGSTLGVELTQFTFETRIGEQAQFDQLKAAVLAQTSGQMAHLRGYAISAVFVDGLGAVVPPPRDPQKLLAALRDFEPPKTTIQGSMPERVPDEFQPMHFDGGIIQGAKLTGDPRSRFCSLRRWELLLSSTGSVSQTETWKRFAKVLEDKDRPENDLVVFVCGSPTVPSNLARPADTFLARAVIEQAATSAVPSASHVQRVWLHSWPERAVYELVPGDVGVRHLCGQPFDKRPVSSDKKA